jgi:hypothetical protein
MPSEPGCGRQRRKRLHPPIDSDVINRDTGLDKQFLDVAVGEAAAQVQTHRDHDDVDREPETRETPGRTTSEQERAGHFTRPSCPARGRSLNATRPTGSS